MDFFIVEPDLSKQAPFAESEHSTPDFKVGQPERCPICNGAVSMLELIPPIEVSLTSVFISDFVYGEISPFIVSENFKTAYEKAGLNGITLFKEVKIINVKGTKKPIEAKYYLPHVKRSEARIDENKSMFKRSGEINCNECKRGSIIESFEGLILVPRTWTGEDIFYAKWLSGTVFLSSAFIRFIENSKLSNARYVEASQYKSRF
jgi:hypothetical protein